MLFIEIDKKILYSNLESSTRVRLTAAHIILVKCSVSLLNFCDAAALILSTVFYLLKQVALSFVGTSCRMISAHTTVSVGQSEVNTGNVSAVWR